MRDCDDIKIEIKRQFKERSKVHNNKPLIIIISICILPFLIFFLIPKPHEYIDDIDNLPDPLQTPADWWVTIEIAWGKVNIDFLAEYDIQWRVLATRNYNDSVMASIWNQISPRDFVLWWWPVMSQKKNIKKFKFIEYLANRTVRIYPKEKYVDWFAESFGIDRPYPYNPDNRIPFTITNSHNHLIRSNKKIKLQLKKVKIWDVIRIKWYLVKACVGNSCRWPSSLVRDDIWYDADWNGSCEIIYVTDITWLKDRNRKERLKNNLTEIFKNIKIFK